MTDIEQKAQALVDKVRSEYPLVADFHVTSIALMRTIEQHEAFRQEVSDVVTSLCNTVLVGRDHSRMRDMLSHRFIIPAPKPDPLVDVLLEIQISSDLQESQHDAIKIRKALDALGFEIREKNDG